MPRMCNNVDFPAPDGPMIETNSPGLMSRLIRRKTYVLLGPWENAFSTPRKLIIELLQNHFQPTLFSLPGSHGVQNRLPPRRSDRRTSERCGRRAGRSRSEEHTSELQ